MSRNMRLLNMKLRENVYEGSLSTILFAEPHLITSSSIYECLQKKMESSVPYDCEVRVVIKFLNASVTGSEIHRRLSNVYGVGNVMFLLYAYKWIVCFNTGWSDTHNEQQTGHEQDSINDETIACAYTPLAVDSQFQTFTERWRSAA